MGVRSKILETLAERYESSQAGRTGGNTLDFQIDFESLLQLAKATTGDAYELAVKDLLNAEESAVIQLERHRVDAKIINKIRIPRKLEDSLFEFLNRPSPTTQRVTLAELFTMWSDRCDSPRFAAGWQSYCQGMALSAQMGKSVFPFDRKDMEITRELLILIPKLLSWERESYLRFASCVLCGSSKRLGELQGRVEAILSAVTNGEISLLSQLGITETGGGCWLHGPVKLRYSEEDIDLSRLSSPAHISSADLRNATIITNASRCLTVENETMLHELAKTGSGVLLISSGFRGGVANSVVVNLIKRLPANMELWHFGDSDPKGFDILRDLRERTQETIHSLHMGFRPSSKPIPLTAEDYKMIQRLTDSLLLTKAEKNQLQAMQKAGNKGTFEQESLGCPDSAWPFY